MIEQYNLTTYENILSFNNDDVDLSYIKELYKQAKHQNYVAFTRQLLDIESDNLEFNKGLVKLLNDSKEGKSSDSIIKNIFSLLSDITIDSSELQNLSLRLLKLSKEQDLFYLLKTVLSVYDPELKKIFFNFLENHDKPFNVKTLDFIIRCISKKYDTTLFDKVIKTVNNKPEFMEDIVDSFSSNQLLAKTALLNAVEDLNILDKDSHVVIWGSWYGSILIPKLTDKVKQIYCVDADDDVLKIAKNNIFDYVKNVDFVNTDIFDNYKNFYADTNLIINTSCEHMAPMKEWTWFQKGALEEDSPKKHVFGSPKLSNDCYFAFQSNNMFGIEGHINCVNSIDEFKDQLPERAEVLYQEEVEDTRGTRYLLVGKFVPL